MSILSGCHKDTIEETEINDFIQQSILNKTPTPENKYAVLMVGLPGSGKTGARERCIPDDTDLNNFVVVDVDMIITQFFTNDIKCYKEAYIIFEKWISFCTENGYNIILEGTGKDLDKRINNLEYYTQLSMLEKQAKDTSITDSSNFEKLSLDNLYNLLIDV
jgi:hypothetical protein